MVYTLSMKAYLSIVPILLLALLSIPQVEASTSIDISNNGAGSKTSVNVRSSTGGNYINGQQVQSGTTKSTNRIEVNGKVYVDETTEGNTSTNIEVKQSGNAEPTIIYNTSKSTTKPEATVSKDGKAAQGEIKKSIEANKAKADEVVKKALERKVIKQETLLARLEALFAKLREIFSR